jgi:radical SAM protein with 4Fe4S-binding SPASM domain
VPDVEYEMRQEDVRYLVKVTPDATFHHSGQTDVLASDDPAFRDYRRRWYENPAQFENGTFPLHLDIEAVGPPVPGAEAADALADVDMVRTVLDEGREHGLCGVKFGFRGNPFAHPKLPEMVAMAKQSGVLDVYIKAEARDLPPDMVEALVGAGLDRISLTVPVTREQSKSEELGSLVERLRRAREARAVTSPRIRVQTYLAEGKRFHVDRFASYWRKVSDEVAYIDLDYHRKEAAHRGIAANWACAKPWQSLCITWDGKILACNHDFGAEEPVGRLGEDTVADAWQSPAMRHIRAGHREGRAHEFAVCDKCVLRYCEISKLAGR